MGSLLATVLLAVSLLAWLGETFFLDGSQLRLARFSSAPRRIFPIRRKFYSAATVTRPVSHRAAWRRIR
jgi:hypothetical protein